MSVLPLVLPLAILLFGGLPIALLARRGPRARLAVARPRTLAAWWLVAALPWVVAWTWILRGGAFTVEVRDAADTARAVAATVLALLALVSLPTAVVTATYLRLRGGDAR